MIETTNTERNDALKLLIEAKQLNAKVKGVLEAQDKFKAAINNKDFVIALQKRKIKTLEEAILNG